MTRLRHRIRHIELLVVLVILPLAACTGESTTAPDQPAAPPASATTLPPDRVAELASMYPRLGSEPLPEPAAAPSASPQRVPPRVASALTDDVLETITGDASFYADTFEGRRTASGIPFRQNQLVAAHRAYPFGTVLRVTNLGNDRAVNVRVVDRGPFGNSAAARRRVIDLSKRAANELGFISAGHTQVRVEVLEWGRGLTG